MKVIIICIVLFALTYNVNGAPAGVDENDLMQLLKDLKTDNKDQLNDEKDGSVAAKLDEDKLIEALLTVSLMRENMNENDIEGFFKGLWNSIKGPLINGAIRYGVSHIGKK